MVYSAELDKGFAEAMMAELKSLAPQSVEGFWERIARGGLEPPHPFGHQILSLMRLPIPPPGHAFLP